MQTIVPMEGDIEAIRDLLAKIMNVSLDHASTLHVRMRADLIGRIERCEEIDSVEHHES